MVYFRNPAMDRKILATDIPSWKNTPEKKFPGCGLIKINSEIVIRDADQAPAVQKLGPVEGWKCDNKEITLPYGTEGKELKIKFEWTNDKPTGQYSNWTYTVSANAKTYTDSNSVPFTQLSGSKRE